MALCPDYMDTRAAAFAATAMHVKRLRRQRAVRNWQSALAKLEHKEKHKEKFKAVLGDIHQCGFEAGVTMRQQLSDFLAWYDDWAYSCPRNQEEQDIESLLYGTMVGYDNVYLRDWNEALARPSAKWKPPTPVSYTHLTLPTPALHAHRGGGEGGSSGLHGIVKSRHNRVTGGKGHRDLVAV